MNESGCNANTKTVSTPRDKLQDKLFLNGRKSPILKGEDATGYRSACMRLSYFAQDRLDFAETAKHLTQRTSGPREFDFIPLKREARYLVGNPKAALRFKDRNMLRKSQSSWTATLLAKSTTGLVAQIGNSHCVLRINASQLDSIERWRSGVLRSGERRSSWTIPEIYVPRSGNSNECCNTK